MGEEDELPSILDSDLGLPTVLRAGYLVGSRYALQSRLGRGGYGSLWKAKDDRTGEIVAVKVLRTSAADTGFKEAAARLEREASLYARLDHPAIARVHDFGTTDQNEPYLVMELLEGADLIATLGLKSRLACAKAVGLLLPIADALAAAHEHGIVHRDVKPGNIFFARKPDGTIQPKLIDFGVAKLLDNVDASQLTGVGMRIGSPSYMSPEQARGQPLDHRSDIWSYCVVLYRSVTGALPFDGSNKLDQRIAILEKSPASLEAHGIYDDELWTIIARGLQKAPAARWPTMAALGDALRSWLP